MQPLRQPQMTPQQMSAQGRYGDSTLVHMNPQEVAGLQALAQRNGTSMTINPQTGLPEAFKLSKLIESLAPAAVGFALGPAGFGLMGSTAAGLTVGAGTALLTGDLSKGITAGLGAYGGAGLSESLAQAGAGSLASAAGKTATEEAIKASGKEAAEKAVRDQLIKDTSSDVLREAGIKAVMSDPKAALSAAGGLGGLASSAMYAAGPAMMQAPETTTQMPGGTPAPVNVSRLKAVQVPSEDGRYLVTKYIKVGEDQYRNGGIVALANGGTPSSFGYREGTTKITPDQFINQYLKPVQTFTPMPGAQRTQTTAAPATPVPVIAPQAEQQWQVDDQGRKYRYVFDATSGSWVKEFEDGTRDTGTAVQDTPVKTLEEAAGVGDGPGVGTGPNPGQAPAPVTTIDANTGQVTGYDPGASVPGVNATPVSVDDPTSPENENPANDGPGGGDAEGGIGGFGSPAGEDGASIGAGGEKEGGLIKLARGGLAQDSFVVPADVVSAMGNGSTKAGLNALNKQLARYAAGGATLIQGPGNGLSDSIPTHIAGKQPARVADGEAYITPQQVKRLGKGNTDRGASKLYAMMDRVRNQAHGKTTQQRPVNPGRALT